jgi:hypothetical protein
MNSFGDLVANFISIITLLIPLIFAFTLLIIIWKVIDAWIIHGGDESKVEDGKNTIIVGIIALVVMSGIWGILSILQSSLFDAF